MGNVTTCPAFLFFIAHAERHLLFKFARNECQFISSRAVSEISLWLFRDLFFVLMADEGCENVWFRGV